MTTTTETAAPPNGQPLTFGYTNWRGEYAVRSAVPMGWKFEATEWHPEAQWLIVAWDVDKAAIRDFAVRDMVPAARPLPTPPADVERLVKALNLFREFVSRNATQWKLGAGSHHHPMWALLAEILKDASPILNGPEWRFIQPENKEAFEALSAFEVRHG